MKVYLHIGMEKTGTTSIERTCAGNEKTLAALGLHYLPRHTVEGRRFAANHDLAKAILGRYDRDMTERVLGHARDFVRRAGGTVLVSSELFARFRPQQVVRLGEVLSGHDVEVVVYVRNQVDWIEGMLKQRVVASQGAKAGKWFRRQLRRCDYLALCERWAAVFGEAAIHARRYDGKPDIVEDFLSVVGINDRRRIVLPREPINPSLAAPAYQMKRIANAFGHSRALRAALSNMQNSAGWREKPQVLDERQDRRVREIAEATNGILWRRYVRDGSAPFALPERSAKPALAIEDEVLAMVVAGLWLEQEGAIAELRGRVEKLERTSAWRWLRR